MRDFCGRSNSTHNAQQIDRDGQRAMGNLYGNQHDDQMVILLFNLIEILDEREVYLFEEVAFDFVGKRIKST